MSLVIIAPEKFERNWQKALLDLNPDFKVELFSEVKNKDEVTFALTWNHPEGSLQQFPNLKVVGSLGAGVDNIFKDSNLPENISITKMVDKRLAKDMSAFVLALVFNHLRRLSVYKIQQQKNQWNHHNYLRIEDVKIGIMGMGTLGTAVGKTLTKNGFEVRGWAKSEKNIEDIKVFAGDKELNDFLSDTDILICLLPQTKETENLLDKNLFQQLPKNAFIINVARGPLVVDEDLIEMIDSGHLSGAALDVFRQEPLPKDHPFWNHPKIDVTPHTASNSSPPDMAPQVLENYKRMENGEQLLNIVDKEKQY